MEKVLNDTYNNKASSAYLAGTHAVYRVAKKKYPKLTLKNVKDFLSRQNVYTLHKPVKKKFPRNKVVATGIDSDWQMDLIDVRPLRTYNKDYTFLLTCIDVFSRYAWAIPIKNKRPASVLEAFKQILKDGRKPTRLLTDSGSEFKADMKQYLKDQGIVHFTATSPDVKAPNIERYNRTLKGRIWKHFTKEKTFTYLDILPRLVDAINRSVCRVTQEAPVDVSVDNEEAIRARIAQVSPHKPPKFLFKIGDRVRITKEKSVLSKGYIANFSEETFVINKRLNRYPATYRLVDEDGESIHGIFYEPELVLVGKVHKKGRRPTK